MMTVSVKNAIRRSVLWQLLREHGTLNTNELAKAFLSNKLLPWRFSVGWILCGDENVGSSRIHGFNLHRYLQRNGVRSFVIHGPAGYVESLEICDHALAAITSCNFDLIVFQRVHGGKARELIRRLRSAGTTTAFFVADLYSTDAYLETDYVFAVSDELKNVLEQRGLDGNRIFVVPDAIETPRSVCKTYQGNAANGPIRVAWVGAAGHWHTLAGIRKLLENDPRLSRYKLVTISNHVDADIAWNLATVWEHVVRCDIGIVPVDLSAPEAGVKSNNRVTAFKALGMPVICSRLPAYEKVIVDGESGFIADTDEEWATHLLALGDPELRRTVGLNGRDKVFGEYGIDSVGARFRQLLHRLGRSRS